MPSREAIIDAPASEAAAAQPHADHPGTSNLGDRLFNGTLWILGAMILVVAGLIVLNLAVVARPLAKDHSLWGFITETQWDPVEDRFGALTFLYGTLVTSMVSLILAVPVAVGLSLFITQFAPPKLGRVLTIAGRAARGHPLGRLRPVGPVHRRPLVAGIGRAVARQAPRVDPSVPGASDRPRLSRLEHDPRGDDPSHHRCGLRRGDEDHPRGARVRPRSRWAPQSGRR